jgi:nucleotide-binding universal stress UspA family protein
MYKTILVPLDGSKRAEAILPHVEDLAQHGDAKVVLLQMVEPVYGTMGADGTTPMLDNRIFEQEISNAESYLADLQAKFHEKGINAQKRVDCGSVVSGIIGAARQEGADLIAMASHGRTGLARVFYGSVAVGVLHSVDRPLLLVRSLDD